MLYYVETLLRPALYSLYRCRHRRTRTMASRRIPRVLVIYCNCKNNVIVYVCVFVTQASFYHDKKCFVDCHLDAT